KIRKSIFIEKTAVFLFFFLFISLGMSNAPKTEEYYCGKILEYMKKSEYVKAGELIEKGLDKHPSSSELYTLSGALFLKRKEHERALDDLSKAVMLDKLNAKAVMYTGAVYHHLKDKRAVSFLEQAVSMDKNLKEAYPMLGMEYLRNGDIRKGSEILNRAAAEAFENGDMKTAEKLTTEVLRRDPSNAETFINSGDILYFYGDKENAAKSWYFSIKNNPEKPEAYIRLGKLYLDESEYKACVDIIEKYTNKFPECSIPEVYYYRGNAYFSLGEYQKGKNILEEGIKKAPDFAENYTLLGSYYIDKGDVEQGITLIKEGLRINPKDAKALLFAASYEAGREKYKKAVRYIEQAEKADPEYSSVYTIGAEIYRKAGRYIKAWMYDRKAKQLRGFK
ncbi:MAG: tetratricopeptide repeat protein, partial [bacterium]